MTICENQEGDFKVDLANWKGWKKGRLGEADEEEKEERMRKTEEVSVGICKFHKGEFKRPV